MRLTYLSLAACALLCGASIAAVVNQAAWTKTVHVAYTVSESVGNDWLHELNHGAIYE